MPVMNIRVVGVAVLHGEVGVPVAMFAAAAPLRVMRMLVVFVLAMFVCMLQHLVQMVMCMVLGEVQPHAQAH